MLCFEKRTPTGWLMNCPEYGVSIFVDKRLGDVRRELLESELSSHRESKGFFTFSNLVHLISCVCPVKTYFIIKE